MGILAASGSRVGRMERRLFTVATSVTINNGYTASFWKSSWLNGNASALLFPSLYNYSRRKNRTMAAAMQNDQWIKDALHDITVPLLDRVVVR